MKVLSININGKTYMTGKITAYVSKEALKIQRDTMAFVKKAKAVQENLHDMDAIESMFEELSNLTTQKTWLICEVYQNQFTPDELEKQFTREEIENEINKIISGVTGIIAKN